ncbi:MAG: replication and repair protein RecF protein, partial [candidate division WWE3 bacterium GW2011_GWB1_47_11]
TYDLIYTKSELSNERLQQYIDREIAARTTLLGPHRDDFRVVLSKYDIATFGSRGQQRSTLLALKLCELDFITQKTGQRPILLLDDIFSELDEKHRKAVTEIVGMQQTIITSADAMKTLPGTANTMKVIKL